MAIDDAELDERMARRMLGRHCYETKMTFLRQEAGFFRKEKREYHTFIHCHDEPPSMEEMKRQMAHHVPMHPLPKQMDIVRRRELTQEESVKKLRVRYTGYF